MNIEKAKVDKIIKSKTDELERRKKELEEAVQNKVKNIKDTVKDNIPKLF